MLSKCIRNTVVGSFIFRVLIKSRKCSLRKESHSKNWAPMLTVLPLSHFLSSVLNSQVLFSEGDCRCWDHVNDLQQMLWMMHEPCGGFTKMSLKIQINLKRVKELWKGILSCMGPAGAPCPIQVATPLLYHAPCYWRVCRRVNHCLELAFSGSTHPPITRHMNTRQHWSNCSRWRNLEESGSGMSLYFNNVFQLELDK